MSLEKFVATLGRLVGKGRALAARIARALAGFSQDFWSKIGEFLAIQRRFRLKGEGPRGDDPTVRKRTIRHRVRRAVFIAGVAATLWTSWTITYDVTSRGVMETKRECWVCDQISKQPISLATVVFLTTTGGATWPLNATWNNALNTVEGIGNGSNGTAHSGTTAGRGGCGGAYAIAPNVSLSSNPSYTIGAANAATDTNFNSGSLIAKAAVTTTPGAAASCTPSTGAFSGGANGNGGTGSTNQSGGGGGGAGGPHGAGSAGASGTSSSSPSITGGTGGAADGGNTAGVSGNTNGNAGTQFTATAGGTAGSGSGAGGATYSTGGFSGRTAGLYGAGGGGGSGNTTSHGTAGAGTQGLLVLTWTPVSGQHRMLMVF